MKKTHEKEIGLSGSKRHERPRGCGDIELNGKTIPLSRRTCIMGVLNITPDSFSDGMEYFDPARALDRVLEMQEEGADIIDIGGESSRPGALPVSADEELARLLPLLKAVRGKIKAVVSVDTSKAFVAEQVLGEGVDLINDITALRGDPRMAGIIASHGAGAVLMHMKGTPHTMQKDPSYGNLMEEIFGYLKKTLEDALRAGIDEKKVILDPGIGFGKLKEHNLEIIARLSFLRELERPLLVGVSRKSFIGEITGKGPKDRGYGTAAAVSAAVLKGADIVRVHDVGEIKDVTKMIDALKEID